MTSIHIKTYGCSQNQADSQIMQALLEQSGFKIVPEEEAELIVVNTCVVKKPTQDKILRYIHDTKNAKKMVITGCLPQTMPEEVAELTMLGTSQQASIVEAVEETLNGNNICFLVPEETNKLRLPSKRINPAIEIIPISSGCLGNCSYCIVKNARGPLSSYPPDDILRRARRAVRSGAKEIWLTSQDTGCFGKDIGTRLPDLLKEIIMISGDYRIRIGMMNPDQFIEISDRLMDLYLSEKVFRFLHLPVQSGSDSVLKAMGRRYGASDFRRVVSYARKKIPDITIATDIICGFPGESDEDFNRTLGLMKELQIPIINISRYTDRKSTQAKHFRSKVGPVKAKERSSRLARAWEDISYSYMKRWLGWKGSVIVDEHGMNNTMSARNYAYLPVILRDGCIGEKKDIEVENYGLHHLYGRIIP